MINRLLGIHHADVLDPSVWGSVAHPNFFLVLHDHGAALASGQRIHTEGEGLVVE